ncbi:Transcriptional regulator, LysR family [Caballeronia sordidicola]|uniref:Transcriptional regulator, LysR family n=1 Tax=Caballeronia sordidicola TaxID=196367 RepID=A0A242M2A6_CABSO|nr:hypothetical protein [Caballeronia sordidicola]OTP65242.1 Transcriptional regulator, LysR family [Caballeronia sordidicola]
MGIGLFAKVSLVDDVQHPEIVGILEEFLSDSRDISIILPRRRFVPARVRSATDFLADAVAESI